MLEGYEPMDLVNETHTLESQPLPLTGKDQLDVGPELNFGTVNEVDFFDHEMNMLPTPDNNHSHEAFVAVVQQEQAEKNTPPLLDLDSMTVDGKPRRRRRKVAVAESLKDSTYHEYRRKNNERARRCRAKHKDGGLKKVQPELLLTLKDLDAKNASLRKDAMKLRAALGRLLYDFKKTR